MESFYIAVTKNGQPEAKPGNLALIAGPFSTLNEAEQHEQNARRYVVKTYELEGAAFWGYSIIGVQDYSKPGKLNEQLGVITPEVIPVAE